MSEAIGVVLAGGAGRRIGGDKAMVELAGRPLTAYPLAALAGVLPEVVVQAKPRTRLPSLTGVTVWIEPERPIHPLAGILVALQLAAGRPVLVCAVDLPFVTLETVRRLARAGARGDAPAVIAVAERADQPLLGCYRPEAAPPLAALLGERPDIPLRSAVSALGVGRLEVDAGELFNVNGPEDVLTAAARLHAINRR